MHNILQQYWVVAGLFVTCIYFYRLQVCCGPTEGSNGMMEYERLVT